MAGHINPDPMTMPDITRHPLFREAYDLAMQKHRATPMSPADITLYIRQIIASFTGMSISAINGQSSLTWPVPAHPDEWQDFIKDDLITCMICHKSYKLLTKAHLRHHGGTKKQYKAHFNIPAEVPLASKELVAQRRKDIEKNRIWELRRKNRPPRRVQFMPPECRRISGEEKLEDLLAYSADDYPDMP